MLYLNAHAITDQHHSGRDFRSLLKDLLRIARSQEAVDCQMKVMVTNADASQVNAVGGKKCSGGNKICYGCGLDGYFSGVLHVVKPVGSVVVLAISKLGVLKFCDVAVENQEVLQGMARVFSVKVGVWLEEAEQL